MNYRLLMPVLFLVIAPILLQAQPEIKKKTDLVNSYPQHIEEFSWQEAWTSDAVVDITYLSNGSPLTINRTDPDGQTRQLYSYNNRGQETERIYQNLVGGQWINFSKETVAYVDEENPESFMSYEWNGSDWILIYGSRYEYTFAGNLVSTTVTSDYTTEGGWVLVSRYTNEYEGGSTYPAAVVTELYSAGSWIKSSRTTYEYSNNQLAAFYLYSWINGEWNLDSKMLYEFGANGSLVIEGYSWLGDAWIPSMRMTDTNDSHGNAILTKTEFYMNGWMIFAGQQFELQYSGSNVVQRITQVWSLFEPGQEGPTTPGWKNSKKEIFSDFASLSVQEWTLADPIVKVYPNPARENIQIYVSNNRASVSSISLMDLSGRNILQQDFLIPRTGLISQDLPNLPEGIYVLRILGSDGAALAKELITIKQ